MHSIDVWKKLYPFPDPRDAPGDEPMALGGDLSPGRLVSAYARGIFPWYDERTPILWWSPDPRFVLFPDELRIPRRLRRELRKSSWKITFDTAFIDVIRACALSSRPGQRGTWITLEMEKAYVHLYQLGYAHSVECWRDEHLAGGLYGVTLGSAFFGESMYFDVPNASKIALVRFVEVLGERGFTLLDCQQETEHMARFGARLIPRAEFFEHLDEALLGETKLCSWRNWPEGLVSSGEEERSSLPRTGRHDE